MDFKKNWAKLTLGVLYLIGAVLALLVTLTPEHPTNNAGNFMAFSSLYWGLFVFFGGMSIFMFCKAFGQKNLSIYALISNGLLASVFFFLNFIHFATMEDPLEIARYHRLNWMLPLMLLVGLSLPILIKGCKKAFCCGKCSKKD